jgi:phosphatidate cytidylyltransferase
MLRVLSAGVLIALLIVTVWLLHPFATVAVAAAIAIIASAELAGLAGQLGATVSVRFVAPVAGVMCVVFALGLAASSVAPASHGGIEPNGLLPLVLLSVIVAAGVLMLAGGSTDSAVLSRASASVMIPLYVGLPLGAIARIRLLHGPQVVSVLALLVIVSDSAQYFVGRLAGRHKLAPLVSPAKTVEGALGGVVAAGVLGATLGAYWIPGMAPVAGALMGVLVASFGIIGDLFESLLKRAAGVKDSSALIPGHGGVLDRIDSWLFAGPVFYIFLRYLA